MSPRRPSPVTSAPKLACTYVFLDPFGKVSLQDFGRRNDMSHPSREISRVFPPQPFHASARRSNVFSFCLLISFDVAVCIEYFATQLAADRRIVRGMKLSNEHSCRIQAVDILSVAAYDATLQGRAFAGKRHPDPVFHPFPSPLLHSTQHQGDAEGLEGVYTSPLSRLRGDVFWACKTLPVTPFSLEFGCQSDRATCV